LKKHYIDTDEKKRRNNMRNRRKTLLTLFLTIVCLIFVFGSLTSQESAAEHFEKAFYYEDVQGDLQKAIDLYKQILKQFPKNREVAAKAQLHVGLCYEKLGLKEAQKAFQKVVDDFPEQKEAVKVAKEKLSVLLRAKSIVEKGDKTFSIRRVWAGLDVRRGNLNTVSPDGRYIAYTDRHGGDLSLLDLINRKQIRLTDNWSLMKSAESLSASEREALWKSGRFYGAAIWSPDSSQLACGAFRMTKECDLLIFGVDGSGPRVLSHNKEFPLVFPLDWSPDGKYILAAFARMDMTGQAVLVSVADGSERILKSFDQPIKGSPNKALFSPDGRYIVCDLPSKQDVEKHDIFLFPSDGSQEIPLVKHPAHDFVLCWSLDGKKLVFASDRTGILSVWFIVVIDGKPLGEPKLIKKDIGELNPLGLTKEGAFYYGLRSWMIDVYTAKVDIENDKLITPPKKATQRFVGSNSAADWSPDGMYFAYQAKEQLYIRSLETGVEHTLTPNLKSFWPLRWSPDGQSILTPGMDHKDQKGLYEIDVQTGEITHIMDLDSDARVRWAMWSSDKKKLFYKYQNPNSLDFDDLSSRIMLFDPTTKEKKELYCEGSWPTFLALSPDGQFLAFQTLDDETMTRRLSIMPPTGGALRHVLNLNKEEVITTLAWMPDSKNLLFAKYKGSQRKCELCQVSVEGGEPKKLGLTMERLHLLSIHPDGKRIAFCSSHLSSEIWVMENFLPKEK